MRKLLYIAGGVSLGIFVILWVLTGIIGIHIVAAPRHGTVGHRDELAGKPVADVSFLTEDGLRISAWCIPNSTENAVILLSGIGCDRGQMTANAEAYVQMGFTALMPDLRGTGQSDGDLVSIGYHERKDLAACVKFLRENGFKRVGAHGFSLGAATICFAFKDVPDLSFAVVESSYDTMYSAINNRLAMYYMPPFIGWPYRICSYFRMGATFPQMSPVNYMPMAKCPVLILSGDSEGYIKPQETKDLYEKCASPKKRIHLFAGGTHEPSIRDYRDEFLNTVRSFFTEDVGIELAAS